MLRRQDNTAYQVRWYTNDGDSFLVTCSLDAEGDPFYYVHEMERGFSSDEEAYRAIEDEYGEAVTGEGPVGFDPGASEASALDM